MISSVIIFLEPTKLAMDREAETPDSESSPLLQGEPPTSPSTTREATVANQKSLERKGTTRGI